MKKQNLSLSVPAYPELVSGNLFRNNYSLETETCSVKFRIAKYFIGAGLYALSCFPPFGGTKGVCQNVGVNSTGALPNASAMLDVSSSNHGLLIPRVSLTSATDVATIASPATSLLVYNTNAAMTGGSVGYWYWDGTQWIQFGAGGGGGSGWLLSGNAGTVDGINFLGTTDNIPLSFRVNNQKAGRIDPAGVTWIGYQAGNSNTAVYNTGIGCQALFYNTTGNWNTAIGRQALYYNTTGNENTASGMRALYYNSTGNKNTATGEQALYNNTTGNNNTGTGMYALYYNSTGSNNTANGYYALSSNTIGHSNIANGHQTLWANTTASQNTAMGREALYTQSYSNGGVAWISDNVAIGYRALFLNQPTSTTNGIQNTAVGNYALYSNTTGYNNTAIGVNALYSNTTGYANVASGRQALYSHTTGYFNTATGVNALYSNTSGNANTAIGTSVLYANTTGYRNTASGVNALQANTTGYQNASYGVSSLLLNTLGYDNTAVGYSTLNNNTTASRNTAIGSSALYLQSYNNGGVAWNSGNVAVGYEALLSNQPTATTNGIYNTAIGSQSLRSNTTGANNTALGYNAFNAGTTYSNSMALGANAVAISGNNQVHIGDASVASIQGQVGFTTYSDARIKNNVQENVPGLSFISELRPVTYYYDIDKEQEITGNQDAGTWEGKYDIEKIPFSGFIAQEVEAAAKQIGYNFSGVDKNGTLWGLRYAEFVVPLVKGMQEQQQMIDNLKSENQNLKMEIETLQTRSHKLQYEFDRRLNNLEKITGTTAEK